MRLNRVGSFQLKGFKTGNKLGRLISTKKGFKLVLNEVGSIKQTGFQTGIKQNRLI